ncbi:MAG: hypothetical protein JST64_05650 [Actinobacteria bacterium]|nr:hypothetical protein [Actinomycetota bacterium]
MLSRLLKARATRAGAAVALVATAFAVTSGSPTQAAPQSKTLTATCSGADDASKGILAGLGNGTLALPFTITSDVPATLDPGAADQPISFTWGVSMDQATVDKAAGVSPSLTVKDMVLDIGISGPTSTTEVQGRPAPMQVALVKGQPVNIKEGPFSGKLADIGKGGIIKYTAKQVGLTISLTIADKATDIKVACAAPGTVAITSIKIPGSPDIKQPIEMEGTPNSTVSVDVLGQYVTPGADEKGTVHPIDPSSLKVIDGPGTVANGQVQVATGAAGTTSSVTFEVCSGTLPGTNAVQSLQIDPSLLLDKDGKPVLDKDGKTQTNMIKKSVGLTLKFGDDTTSVIWTVPKAIRDANPNMFQPPTNWADTYNSNMLFWIFFVPFEQPSPADIQAALEALPSIGAGGVKVTAADPAKPGLYNIEFTGKNGQKDVPNLSVGNYYSVFPQEHLNAIIDDATKLLNPPAPPEGTPTTTTTLPGGAANVDDAVAWLEQQMQDALGRLDLDAWSGYAKQWVQLKVKQGMANIDFKQVISALTSIFSTPPLIQTTVAGEPPIGMCSQGVIDVSVPAPPEPTVLPTSVVQSAPPPAGHPATYTG